jgi:regulator of protease activity HflC (stomatin/prohibitin superfamily)
MWIIAREWERVVLFRDGRVEDVLGPGRHRVRSRRLETERVDVRERQYAVSGQEILTSDAVAVKVSAIVVWRVADPALYLTEAEGPLSRLHVAVQQALRVRVAAVDLESLMAARDAVTDGVAEEIRPELTRLGIEVVSVNVRDLMLPAEIRRAVTEVLLARERGRADLERARSEAAALRSLANTARLLEEHPGLLHLRTLQAAGQGATLVVTSPRADL